MEREGHRTIITLHPAYFINGLDWHGLFAQYRERLVGLSEHAIKTFESFKLPAPKDLEECRFCLFKEVKSATYHIWQDTSGGFVIVSPSLWPLTCAPYDIGGLVPYSTIEPEVNWYEMLFQFGCIHSKM
jgi:hypothetical protein